jgi:precorrin-3B synthase
LASDPDELINAGKLAADLRDALAQSSLASRLSPKVSVVIDGGGAHRLDGLASDIRARAIQTGDGNSLVIEAAGHDLGSISPGNTVAAVTRLLEVVARHGRETRARDVISTEGTAVFRAAIANLLNPVGPCRSGNEQTSIGMWRLHGGSLACGIALPFGHTDAASLQQLADTAGLAGAHGFRTAPGRTLLAIGLTEKTAESFMSAAKNHGLIVNISDPRRHVVACAGAPICGAAHIGARQLGPQIATAAAPYLDSTFTIHVSGCAKGCAYPSPAALTIVGTEAGCALVANGAARDTPFMTVTADELASKAAEIARTIKGGAPHV